MNTTQDDGMPSDHALHTQQQTKGWFASHGPTLFLVLAGACGLLLLKSIGQGLMAFLIAVDYRDSHRLWGVAESACPATCFLFGCAAFTALYFAAKRAKRG